MWPRRWRKRPGVSNGPGRPAAAAPNDSTRRSSLAGLTTTRRLVDEVVDDLDGDGGPAVVAVEQQPGLAVEPAGECQGVGTHPGGQVGQEPGDPVAVGDRTHRGVDDAAAVADHGDARAPARQQSVGVAAEGGHHELLGDALGPGQLGLRRAAWAPSRDGGPGAASGGRRPRNGRRPRRSWGRGSRARRGARRRPARSASAARAGRGTRASASPGARPRRPGRRSWRSGSGSHTPGYDSRCRRAERRTSSARRVVTVTSHASAERMSVRSTVLQRSATSPTTSSASTTLPSIR